MYDTTNQSVVPVTTSFLETSVYSTGNHTISTDLDI